MNITELNELAAKLIELNINIVKPEEYEATKTKDFETLKKNAEVQGAIETILKYIDEQ